MENSDRQDRIVELQDQGYTTAEAVGRASAEEADARRRPPTVWTRPEQSDTTAPGATRKP